MYKQRKLRLLIMTPLLLSIASEGASQTSLLILENRKQTRVSTVHRQIYFNLINCSFSCLGPNLNCRVTHRE